MLAETLKGDPQVGQVLAVDIFAANMLSRKSQDSMMVPTPLLHSCMNKHWWLQSSGSFLYIPKSQEGNRHFDCNETSAELRWLPLGMGHVCLPGSPGLLQAGYSSADMQVLWMNSSLPT